MAFTLLSSSLSLSRLLTLVILSSCPYLTLPSHLLHGPCFPLFFLDRDSVCGDCGCSCLPVLRPGACPGCPPCRSSSLIFALVLACVWPHPKGLFPHGLPVRDGLDGDRTADTEAQVHARFHLINYLIDLRNNQEFYYIYLDSIFQIS